MKKINSDYSSYNKWDFWKLFRPATVMFVTVTVVAFVVVDYDIACFFFFLALSGTLVKLYLIKIQWEFMLSSESIFLVKFQSEYRWMANYKQNG